MNPWIVPGNADFTIGTKRRTAKSIKSAHTAKLNPMNLPFAIYSIWRKLPASLKSEGSTGKSFSIGNTGAFGETQYPFMHFVPNLQGA
jgi:hypothetical protein